MSPEVEVDGSFFAFSDGWLVEKVDEWREQRLFVLAVGRGRHAG